MSKGRGYKMKKKKKMMKVITESICKYIFLITTKSLTKNRNSIYVSLKFKYFNHKNLNNEKIKEKPLCKRISHKVVKVLYVRFFLNFAK